MKSVSWNYGYQHTIYFIYLFYECFDDLFCLFKIIFIYAVRYIQGNVDIEFPTFLHLYFLPVLIWHREQVSFKKVVVTKKSIYCLAKDEGSVSCTRLPVSSCCLESSRFDFRELLKPSEASSGVSYVKSAVFTQQQTLAKLNFQWN